MKQHDDIEMLSSELFDQQAWPREPLPDSTALEARILAKTQHLPQTLVSADGSSPTKGSVISLLGAPFLPVAMVASVLIVVVLWLPLFKQDTTPVETEYLLTLEELDFQEAMLLDDELLFSQL